MKFLIFISLSILINSSFSYVNNGDWIGSRSQSYCDLINSKPACDSYAKYRSYDGTCNNLRNPFWGAAHTELTGILNENYGDGVASPTTMFNGSALPNPRTISVKLFPIGNAPTQDLNLAFVNFAQFAAEDQAFNADTENLQKCCGEGGNSHGEGDPMCNNVQIPIEDPTSLNGTRTCYNFVRTTTDRALHCQRHENSPAAQLNMVTSFLDLSVVYDVSANALQGFRDFQNGRLTMQNRNGFEYPPNGGAGCNKDHWTDMCYKGGDLRMNFVPGMTMMHIFFNREHNRIASNLKKENPHWNDERLFNESRRINIAIYQHIIYNEFLPLLLGKEHCLNNLLNYNSSRHVNDYSSFVNPAIIKEHSSAANRVFHSMVEGTLKLYDEFGETNRSINLADFYLRPKIIEQDNNYDFFARGMVYQPAQKIDRFHDDAVHNRLFRINSIFGQDLKALDIMRGRDHGLPSYNDMRVFCGLRRATTWGGFEDVIPKSFVSAISHIYSSVNDVELNVGAALENPEPNSIVGRTFNCILTKQYYNLRAGDRFFYETGNQYIKFTNDQLIEIRKMTISRIICSNSNEIKQMPMQGFIVPGVNNPMVNCTSIIGIKFNKWREIV